jgi:glycosyltransferase involved in cell wall biosynthesis
MISVVIPTRNRPVNLANLINSLNNQTVSIGEVIIVDSSDEIFRLDISGINNFKIELIRTEVKSAAIQRNIGMEHLSERCELLYFLDDDVLPDPNYLENLAQIIGNPEIVGASGLAKNPLLTQTRQKPRGIVGFVHKLFLLDSEIDGKLLLSGVNIPVRSESKSAKEVDWLIGCSIWKYEKIKSLRFEKDFLGQSLAEDVIFSVQAKKQGKLLTDPEIILIHEESKASPKEHWEMWMVNRWRLVQVMETGFRGKCAFWWASIGQIGILTYGNLFSKPSQSNSLMGLWTGCIKICRGLR